MKKRSVVHLFDFDRGSRYHLMIAQGLAAHPGIDVSYGAPVVSLGRVTAKPTSDLSQNLLRADAIFRPDDEHYRIEEVDRFLDAHDLWRKVAYYDKKDSPRLDAHRLRTCSAYLKRSWPVGSNRSPRAQPERPVLPVAYSLLNEYFHLPIPIAKDLDVVCPFLDDPKIGRRRFAVVRALADARHRLGSSAIGTRPVRGRDARRAILAPSDDNLFLDYLSFIQRAKIVFTAYPETQDGDSRTWEAFASGALVFKDTSHTPSPHPFEHGKHCIIYDASREASIHEAIDLAVYYLKHDAERVAIARAGLAHARRHHMPRNRVEAILDWVDSPDKRLEDHVVGPVEFA